MNVMCDPQRAPSSQAEMEVTQRGFHSSTKQGELLRQLFDQSTSLWTSRESGRAKKWITGEGENACIGVAPDEDFRGTWTVEDTRWTQLETKQLSSFLYHSHPVRGSIFWTQWQLWQQSGSSHGFFVPIARGKFHKHSGLPCTQSKRHVTFEAKCTMLLWVGSWMQ